MKQTKLSVEDQQLVDKYVLQESINPRKNFRPWAIFLWWFVVLVLLGIISRMVSYFVLDV